MAELQIWLLACLMASVVSSAQDPYVVGEYGGRCYDDYSCNRDLYCYNDTAAANVQKQYSCQECNEDICGRQFIPACVDFCKRFNKTAAADDPGARSAPDPAPEEALPGGGGAFVYLGEPEALPALPPVEQPTPAPVYGLQSTSSMAPPPWSAHDVITTARSAVAQRTEDGGASDDLIFTVIVLLFVIIFVMFVGIVVIVAFKMVLQLMRRKDAAKHDSSHRPSDEHCCIASGCPSAKGSKTHFRFENETARPGRLMHTRSTSTQSDGSGPTSEEQALIVPRSC